MTRSIALRAAKEALDNVGVQETGDNRGKAVEVYQASTVPPVPPGSPWCAAFVVYRFRNAAHDLALSIPLDWPRSAYCPDHGNWARRTKNWVGVKDAEADPTKVRIGDLCCFWFAPLNRLAHIGIVIGVYPWGVKTVEGNTSPEMEDEDQVTREGDGVYRKARAFFICDDGCKLLDTDYMSLEPRVFASVTGDAGLKLIFSEDLDFYSHIAIQTEKLEGVSSHTKADNYLKKVDPVKRQTAKSYSLGVPYGMSGYALAMTLGIDRKEGDRLVEGYLDGFPDLRKWREESRAFVKRVGYIKNRVGRIRHLPRAQELYALHGDRLTEDFKYRKGLERNNKEQTDKDYRDYKNALNNCLNYQIQSYSASIVNRAALQINRKFTQENIQGQVIAQIHDQLICQVREEDAKKACEIVQYCMENTTKLDGVDLIAIPEITINFKDGH